MRTVLVTGGNGFIGRYVTETLLARGYEVSILDSRTRPVPEHANLVFGDMRDATSVTEAAAHADGIIHLAGVLGTQETISNPRPAAETNILGGLNVMEASIQYHLPMVNIAVGNHWMNNTYSITKSVMERFADMYNRYRGGQISIVRALNAYGPRQSVAAPFGPSKVRKIMPSFVCRALSSQPIEVYGDGTQIMDMIYVADVAEILVRALEFTAANGPLAEPIEAGSGNPTSVNDIAFAVIDAVQERYGTNSVLTHLPMRPGEDERSIVLGNPDTLRAIDFDPDTLTTLEVGVERAVEYFHTYLQEQWLL